MRNFRSIALHSITALGVVAAVAGVSDMIGHYHEGLTFNHIAHMRLHRFELSSIEHKLV